MLIQLVVGTVIVSLTVVVTALFIGAAIHVLERKGAWLAIPPYPLKTAFGLIAVTLWLLLAISVNVWIWAATYLTFGLFKTLEPALYFSVVSFTTLGFGDITLDASWRILSGITAANGLLLFGVSTAFLVTFISDLYAAQTGER